MVPLVEIHSGPHNLDRRSFILCEHLHGSVVAEERHAVVHSRPIQEFAQSLTVFQPLRIPFHLLVSFHIPVVDDRHQGRGQEQVDETDKILNRGFHASAILAEVQYDPI